MPHPLSLDLSKDYWKGMQSLKYEIKGFPMREGSSLLTAIIVITFSETVGLKSAPRVILQPKSFSEVIAAIINFECRPEMFNTLFSSSGSAVRHPCPKTGSGGNNRYLKKYVCDVPI
jgi:hypothetical protein